MQNASLSVRLISGIPVLIVGGVLVPLAFYSLLASSLILVSLCYLVAGIFCLYVAFLIFTRAPIHAATIAFIVILGTGFVVALGVLAHGVINDALGTRCTGFFGVQTECASNAWLTVMILAVIFPVVPLCIGLFAAIVWVVQYRYLVKYLEQSTPTR